MEIMQHCSVLAGCVVCNYAFEVTDTLHVVSTNVSELSLVALARRDPAYHPLLPPTAILLESES